MTSLLRILRALANAPGFTATVVVALALGVGANAAIYSLFDRVVVNPLPVEEADRLFEIEFAWSYADYQDFRDRADVFTDLAAFANRSDLLLGHDDRSQVISGALISSNYFETLGIAPTIGRTFGESDVGEPVVVIGHDLWQSRFEGSDDVLGQTIMINGQDYSIVGVAPPRFRGTSLSSDHQAWLPLDNAPQIMAGPMADLLLTARDFTWLRLIGRLQDGVRPEQAMVSLDQINRQIGEEYPDLYREPSVNLLSVTSTALGFQREDTLYQFIWILAIMVALVLLVACANVASLLLTRAMRHRKDHAIRLALGARRGHLIRRLLLESVVLSLLGGALGLVVAIVILRLMSSFELPGDIALGTLSLGINWRVLGFALGLSTAVGILFGLFPALRASRPNLVDSLKDQVPAQSHSRAYLRSALVIAQVAFSLVLLIGAGLFMRSFQQALRTDVGFDTERVALLSVDLGLLDYQAARAEAYYRQALDRVRSRQGVQGAAWANLAPFRRARVETLSVAGYVPAEEEDTSILVNYVTPGYFRTLGLDVLRGRDFDSSDSPSALAVGVINQTTAERYWPQGDATGWRISLDSGESWIQIAGVVEDSKYRELGEAPTTFLYLPLYQHIDAAGVDEMSLFVRAENPARLIPEVRDQLLEIDSNTPVLQAQPLRQHMADILMPQRMGFTLLGAFSVVALILAAVGIYGLLSYLVSMRSHEIGVRMAMGAERGQIVKMMFRRSAVPVAIGVLIGLLLAFWSTQLISAFLFGIERLDLITFGLTTLTLIAVALLASSMPAFRASRLSPSRALYEP